MPVAFGFDTLSVGLILEPLEFSQEPSHPLHDESPDHIHRQAQLLGNHLGHLRVHPLTHLNPSVGNGYTAVVVVDGNVDSVPGGGKGISMFPLKEITWYQTDYEGTGVGPEQCHVSSRDFSC